MPELDIDIRLIDDDFGRFVQLFFKRDVPNGAVTVNVLQDSRGRTVRAIDAFADRGQLWPIGRLSGAQPSSTSPSPR